MISDAVMVSAIGAFLDTYKIKDYSVGELLVKWTQELSNAECSFCARNYLALWHVRGKRYAHRASEGRNGGTIWVPCRASLLYGKIRKLAESEQAGTLTKEK